MLVDHALSPSQERNLEQELKCRVLDRTGLILDIFAQRARSFEGKLQVELAQLKHLATRLVRGWTHLERQKGGIGLRGPGETQLETDRRLLGKRIKTLNDRLDKVLVQRETTRRDAAAPSRADGRAGRLHQRRQVDAVQSADRARRRTPPTSCSRRSTRRCAVLRVAAGLDIALADTVGFVRDLPHELVAAFRSTLPEAREADLLLHVIDAADPERDERIAQVDHVLDRSAPGDMPQIAVYNKIDRTGEAPRIEFRRRARGSGVAVGADRRGRRAAARGAPGSLRSRPRALAAYTSPHAGGRARARFTRPARCSPNACEADGGFELDVWMRRPDLERICREEGLDPPAAMPCLAERPSYNRHVSATSATPDVPKRPFWFGRFGIFTYQSAIRSSQTHGVERAGQESQPLGQ